MQLKKKTHKNPIRNKSRPAHGKVKELQLNQPPPKRFKLA